MTGRERITRTPQVLKAHPPRLLLLRRWARLVKQRFGGSVYLFGSAARGSLDPRDYDIALVLSDEEFVLRYATPAMLQRMSARQIIDMWDKEEQGLKPTSSLWDRWVKEKRRIEKQAFHLHTGLVIDFHVRPISLWRLYVKIQYWRLA